MGIEPGVFGKERGVNVDEPPSEHIDEPRLEDLHESCERDDVGGDVAEGVGDPLLAAMCRA